MSGPVDKDAPQPAPTSRTPEREEVARARKRERDRRYRLEHPEEHAAQRRRWVEANRDRIRESNRRWRETHLERARELNRDSMRRAADRKRREAETRAKARVRVRVWREEHPDRVRKYQRDWVEANRDKVREYYNRYYRTHRDEVNARATARRDADPAGAAASKQAWAADHKEHRAELQRARRADPEVYAAELEANAAARRLKRALARAGLPPRRLHPATAAERRANERAAVAFFGDPSLPEHVHQSTVFVENLTKHMLLHHARMREFAESYVATRERMGLPPANADDVMWARAVDVVLDGSRRVDLLTSRDVAAAVRAAKATMRRAEQKRQHERLVEAVVVHVQRNRVRLAADAAMESRARRMRGKPSVDRDELLVRIALQEVAAQVPTTLLAAGDIRRALGRASFALGQMLDAGSSDNQRGRCLEA
ncbi:hypothetical protein [Agromyces bauzanensis]|uniref:Uncharacterized protein n=1 Tax=Agromyces bauzanensis TaxID=1308924 RepID=A0A917PGK7_9MICO|nr:hypothetical protein [Agromyces bauzanensis]GGJ76657.1 hypothetical protein GCM10011372_13620 [Agromyces bauzanensis]